MGIHIIGVMLLGAVAANATIISVTNNPSTAGNSVAGARACAAAGYSLSAQIIGAPTSVADDAPGAENCAQQGFDEQQSFLLTQVLDVEGPADIAIGTLVDSHMIFLNSAAVPNQISHQQVVWTFDGLILGVISQRNGQREANSNYLGAAGTFYPGAFSNRGMESPGDNFIIAGNLLTVNMAVSEPGDWIRVITAPGDAEIPEPATFALMGAGLLALGLARRRRAA